MIKELDDIKKMIEHDKKNHIETVELYPSITLYYIILKTNHFNMHHDPLDNILEINYCYSGRIGWEMGNGNSV